MVYLHELTKAGFFLLVSKQALGNVLVFCKLCSNDVKNSLWGIMFALYYHLKLK